MPEALRYERKAFITDLSYADVEAAVRTHPALFREIYQERTINNIYFDSVDFRSFRANLDGDEDRLKVRVRWYGPMLGKIESPLLELKIKHNNLGSKKRYPIRRFILEDGFDLQAVTDAIAASKLPAAVALRLDALAGKLLNRYSRRYFESVCRGYRITIDRNLQFYGLQPYNNNLLHMASERKAVVLELKYQREHDGDADRIASRFSFFLTKSSKYVHGIERLWL